MPYGQKKIAVKNTGTDYGHSARNQARSMRRSAQTAAQCDSGVALTSINGGARVSLRTARRLINRVIGDPARAL